MKFQKYEGEKSFSFDKRVDGQKQKSVYWRDKPQVKKFMNQHYPEKVVTINRPFPREIAFYQLTDFVDVQEVYNGDKYLWNDWKAEGLIPPEVVDYVEDPEDKMDPRRKSRKNIVLFDF